jgi:uncharacterized protein (TIGR02001 family)
LFTADVLRPGLRAALGAALLVLVCVGVSAQTGGSIALLSDYRYRGVSLSDDRPTLRLSVVHDAESGWYAGGSLAGVSLEPSGRQLQVLGYLGLTGKFAQGLGWDAGATAIHFSADSRFDFLEVFTGVHAERWNLRLHYAPDYFGSGARTAYVELNGGLPLSRFVRATAHVGGLARLAGTVVAADRWSFDGAVGLAMARDAWDLQIDLTSGSNGSGVYPVGYDRVRGVLVLSASYAF